MTRRQRMILSDFGGMDEAVRRLASRRPEFAYQPLPSRATWGRALRIATESNGDDLIIVNGDLRWINRFCVLKFLLPRFDARLIVVDLVLRIPKTTSRRLTTILKRRLWSRIDLFLHYFRDLSGYARHFGITADRSEFVRFKANIPLDTRAESSGEFVYMAGESMRDYGTFIEAASITKLPTAILNPDVLKRYGVRYDARSLPENLTLLADDGSRKTWLTNLGRARVYVACISPESICASGISSYLEAMVLGKPVIITRGPGADDVLDDEAVFVPPSDPEALAEAIRELWSNSQLRERQVERGSRYVKEAGGTDQLLDRVLAAALRSNPDLEAASTGQ